MKTFVPSYYTRFSCLAGACAHTCCVGWEIDVDSDTRELYQTLPGALGDTLRQHLQEDAEGICSFRLTEDERCPMLRQDGLCQIICEAGEEALCQICSDHPRFRNYFSDRVELGLGLCCEAAANLILQQQAPMTLTVLEEDDGT